MFWGSNIHLNLTQNLLLKISMAISWFTLTLCLALLLKYVSYKSVASLCSDSISSVDSSGVIIRLLKSSAKRSIISLLQFMELKSSTIKINSFHFIVTYRRKDRIVIGLANFLLSRISWMQTMKIDSLVLPKGPSVEPKNISESHLRQLQFKQGS